jgi:hypothetical protein
MSDKRRQGSQAGMPASRSSDALEEVKDDVKQLREEFQAVRSELPQQLLSEIQRMLDASSQQNAQRVEQAVAQRFAEWENKQEEKIQALEQKYQVLESKFHQQMADFCDEVQDRSSRCCNVVIHGMPETVSDVQTCFTQHYIKALGPQVSAADVVSVIRLGRRRAAASSPGSSRPRPVLVKFTSVEKRDNALRNKRLFSAGQSGLQHRLFVDPDLTRRQQQQKRALVPTFKALKINNARPFWRAEVLYWFPPGKERPEPHPANTDPTRKLCPEVFMPDAEAGQHSGAQQQAAA